MNHILQTIDITTITLGRALTLMGCAIASALVIMLVYIFTHRRSGWRPSVMFTMLLLGPIVSIIVICIGSNIARAISIGGGLALIRFRNTVEDPRDIIYFYLSIASGMACGVGFIGFGAIALGLILAFIIIMSVIGLDRSGGRGKRLRILIPESLDYTDVFDPILKKYCKYYHLNRIKTTDYGTLLELDFRVVMKNKAEEKQFIDELRERNGNLNISLIQNMAEEL
ncbi:MAG: DUF4956 domain-containing protein [Clostridia bacterium]|nr:DUF4956 domain-containing protein [Clostridia bacterium]